MSKIIKIGQPFLNLQPIIWVDVFLKHGVVLVLPYIVMLEQCKDPHLDQLTVQNRIDFYCPKSCLF